MFKPELKVKKVIKQIFIIFIIITMNSCIKSNIKEGLINELENHMLLGNINKELGLNIKEYFMNGGSFDSDDWLYYIMSDYKNNYPYNINESQKYRNQSISINESEIYEKIYSAGFYKNKKHAASKIRYQLKRKELGQIVISYLIKDKSKSYIYELEDDVIKDNNRYKEFITDLGKLSNLEIIKKDIIEIWETDEGPIEIMFKIENDKYLLNPEYDIDWYDPNTLTQIINIFKSYDNNYRIVNGYFVDYPVILYLTNKELKVLEEEFKIDLE